MSAQMDGNQPQAQRKNEGKIIYIHNKSLYKSDLYLKPNL